MQREIQSAVTRSPEGTRRLAARLAGTLEPGAVLALHGDLGSGKTCFVQGLAAALGSPDAVTSPTFTLVHEYRGARPLYHVDLYRIGSADEAYGLGLEDCLDSKGITVIEWAERASGLLPARTWHLEFEVLPGRSRRRIRITRPGD